VGDARWDRDAAGQFVDHYNVLYGQVRTHVVHAHLTEHLPPPPAEIIDVGGGAGHQSIPLARAGYRVLIADPSTVMLEAAQVALAAEPDEVAGRVSLVESDGERAPDLLGTERFDGVLCHGVLMYLEEPRPLERALVALARPGGVLSVVGKSRRSLAMRPAATRDWAAVLAAFDADHQVNELGIDTRADDPEELGTRFAADGAATLAWYGVRLFSDQWARDRSVVDPSDLVLAAELEASRRDPYRQLSRLFHWLGRKG
jgi:2-polyprenyl-3-methyl-5-hydroxy-6-metoxy-1,4-benzoquinol methylase